MNTNERQDGWYAQLSEDRNVAPSAWGWKHNADGSFSRIVFTPRIPSPDEPVQPDSRALDPRDLLVHLRQWLTWHRELHTKHFGDSDDSGHPHGYDGVVIPVWDLRQRFDEINASIAIPAPPDSPQTAQRVPEALAGGDRSELVRELVEALKLAQGWVSGLGTRERIAAALAKANQYLKEGL